MDPTPFFITKCSRFSVPPIDWRKVCVEITGLLDLDLTQWVELSDQSAGGRINPLPGAGEIQHQLLTLGLPQVLFRIKRRHQHIRTHLLP
jgi:hypothetical protein